MAGRKKQVPERKKKSAAATVETRTSIVLTLTFSGLLVAVGVSGIALVDRAHSMRSLYSALGEVQREQDGLLEEHSRLMLERGTLGSMQNIEVVAQDELGMRFPDAVGQVLE